MAIVQRPYSRILQAPATINLEDFGGSLHVFYPSHNLSDGSQVYIKSRVDNYNGFWYVYPSLTFDPANYFLIKRNTGSDPIGVGNGYTVDLIGTDAEAQKILTLGGWNAIEQPIVYQIENFLWPTNTIDTVRTITTVTDSNGYCALGLSGDIKATGSAAELEFVKITGATDDDLNGVWQIVDYTNDTTFSVAIPYSSANDTALTNASIQYYYNNYNLKVNLYAGLNAAHYFADQKPYELMTTLDLTPDNDNLCTFSVHKCLKSKVSIKNNLLLGTLPNNLDAFTQFYIEFAESYDTSDGADLSTFTSAYTTDQPSFEGIAVTAKLPFKNKHSGALNEYSAGDSTQKFLTLFDEPSIFSGQYFDLSFLFDNSTSVQFNDNAFASDLSAWVTLDNSGSAGWAFSGGNAVCNGATPNTDFIGQLRTTGGGWPPGDYSITITATNTSTGGSSPFLSNVFLYGSQISSAIEDGISLTGTNGWTVGAGSVARTLTFTLTKHYAYLWFDFEKAGPTSGYNVNIAVASIVINSAPTFETSFPIVRQGSTDTELSAFSSGVYRTKLDDPNCSNSSVNVTIYKGQPYGIPNPSVWTNYLSSFTTKTTTSFTTTAAGTTNNAYVNIPVSVTTGKRIKFTVTITVSVSTPGTSLVHFYLCGGVVGTPTSNVATAIVPAAAGTNTFEVELTATSTSGILFVDGTLNSGGGGSTLTITMPEEFNYYSGIAITETKAITINCDCVRSKANGYNLSWINNLGGFDHWYFTGYADENMDIEETEEIEENIFPNWPSSYGEFADTERRQTYRSSREGLLLRSQYITSDQLHVIKKIKSSPLVQIVNSIYDRRTVIVDSEPVTKKQGTNLYEISFTVKYTDEVPSQSV